MNDKSDFFPLSDNPFEPEPIEASTERGQELLKDPEYIQARVLADVALQYIWYYLGSDYNNMIEGMSPELEIAGLEQDVAIKAYGHLYNFARGTDMNDLTKIPSDMLHPVGEDSSTLKSFIDRHYHNAFWMISDDRANHRRIFHLFKPGFRSQMFPEETQGVGVKIERIKSTVEDSSGYLLIDFYPTNDYGNLPQFGPTNASTLNFTFGNFPPTFEMKGHRYTSPINNKNG